MRFSRVFWKKTSKRIFQSALLTAVIVFCTALATQVTSTDLTSLVLVSAGLSAVAAFSSTLLEYVKHEKEAERDSNR